MAVRKPLDLERELLDAFEHSGRVTEHLVRVLPLRERLKPVLREGTKNGDRRRGFQERRGL
jgi:hypothetical protein